MPTATLPSVTSAPAPDRVDALRSAARRLADAVEEFDAALDAGCAMNILVNRDQEVAAATEEHRAALAPLPLAV